MGKLYRNTRSSFWWASYVSHDGKRRRRSTGCRDKANAQKILTKWESDKSLIQHGVKSVASDFLTEPLGRHVDAYLATIEARKTGKYAQETRNQIAAIADYCSWKTLGSVDADGLESFVNHLNAQGRSARTVSAYINALRQFCKWCVTNGRLTSNPIVSVEKPGLKGKRRYCRRMLLQDEWQKLKASMSELGVERNGQTASERLVMYWTAIETGLRSAELRQLTKHSLKLHAEPHVLAAADTTKNANVAKQYISDPLAKELRRFVKRNAVAINVFTPRSRHRMAKHLRADVEAAGIDYTNDNGEVLDFHALRHTCGAWLVLANVTLPEVQSIMRHSTITLTIDAYGHLAPDAASRNRHILGKILAK